MEIKNLIAATYAPLKEDGSLNLGIIKEYGFFLKSNKVAGAFVNGSTGDFASLTPDERKLIIDAWAADKPSNFALINHVGDISLKTAKDLASHCADKVDAIATLSPFYFKPRSLQQLVDYCTEVAMCAPNLPFYYYHIPVLTGAHYSMEDFLELAENQIPNLAGIKFTNNDVLGFKHSKNFNNNKYNILYGVDEMFLSSLPYEATGWVGSTYNHLAPLYYKIKYAFENGNISLAAQLMDKSVQFIELLDGRGGFNGAGKSFMKILGIDCGPSRFPHKTFSNEELVEIKGALKKLGIMSYTNRL
ncbi:N-acetylneuraminate lyase [Yeosuana aromativorans]|uniref:N-acetylneuraminate lyase n=1 Tax=Yeosuana aromativorans TaxID=288019 RepID=A0A8J3BPK1_9FLAO|nr:dihydrodipicolinate synthase family protein [Yeosuana aromativorans]GGK33968.1 N-acetylneuraminate lyase [Yeosuana aromativorans]